jgi:hypothetical protein
VALASWACAAAPSSGNRNRNIQIVFLICAPRVLRDRPVEGLTVCQFHRPDNWWTAAVTGCTSVNCFALEGYRRRTQVPLDAPQAVVDAIIAMVSEVRRRPDAC